MWGSKLLLIRWCRSQCNVIILIKVNVKSVWKHTNKNHSLCLFIKRFAIQSFKWKTSSGDLLHDFLLGQQVKAQDEALGLTNVRRELFCFSSSLEKGRGRGAHSPSFQLWCIRRWREKQNPKKTCIVAFFFFLSKINKRAKPHHVQSLEMRTLAVLNS